MAHARPTPPPPMDAPPHPPPSPSPPPQPLTKRDVRRKRAMEKLDGIFNSFAANQSQHYRAQIQGLQVDMALVFRADPYSNAGPLPDGQDDLRTLVQTMMSGDANGHGGLALPTDEAARNDFWSLAGKRYSEYVREVNTAVEERDADLASLHRNYTSSQAELDRRYQQRLHQAEEEHKALSATIRQRLTNSLNKKRVALIRDKDSIDVADSNAMLLHPNHFSFGNNPTSPGHNGVAHNKRTRHLRGHRGGSPAPAGAEAENGKRRRKPHQVDDEQIGNESPVPFFAGARSPLKDARIQKEHAQFDAPAYSLDRLFTEKELAMATDTAKTATYKYFHMPQQQPPEGSGSNGTGVPSIDGEPTDSADAGTDEAMLDAGGANGINTPPANQPAAAEMERTTSSVLTRGGAKANPLAALSDLANAAAAASSSGPATRENPFTPHAPTYHPVAKSEKAGAPPPYAVSPAELESDFEMMMRAGADGSAENGATTAVEAHAFRRQLLDQALEPPGVKAPFRLPLVEAGPGAKIGRGIDREARTGFAPAVPAPVTIESRMRSTANLGSASGGSLAAALAGRLGAEPMSRTTSAGGVSETGDAVAPKRGRGTAKLV